MPEDGTKGLGTLADTLRKVPAIPTRMPDVGEVFAGRYDIQRLLGRGGMGVVYLANQSPLGREVALKILKPPESLEDDPNFDERFLREAAAAARLSHPNTITVHDFGQADDGALYIVMEYLEGNDVRAVLSHEGAFSPARAIHVAKQVCKSLREAHRKGIIHRDLKPANVLLVDRDEDLDFVKVLDFGLVKFRGEASEITLAGKFLGSPRYTSPEALDRNKEVDHRADIYALGILLFTMITGHPPFDGDPMQVLHAHLHEKPKPMWKLNPASQTTPELEELVAKCLEKDAEKRYQSMGQLVIALRAVGAAFGQEDTETLDLEVNESLELDLEPGSIPAVEPLAPPPPAPRPAAAPGTSSARAQRPRKVRRNKRSPVLPVLGGIAALLLAAIAFLVLKPGDSRMPPPEENLGAAAPGEIEVGDAAALAVSVTSDPAGATVDISFDGTFVPLGTTPVTLPEYRAPYQPDSVTLRISLDGHVTREVDLPTDDGSLSWSGTLRPDPSAVPTPRTEPAAKAAPQPEVKPTPKPEAKPTLKPEAKPTPKPEAKPTPKPEAKPDKVPSGYKDNPY
ncbi:MAG: protein kinase [Deltaproteobacteria bacterium]|nr:protein kinase [Deltaproteobacteria bacterium]